MVFSDLLFPKANNIDMPMVVSINQDEIEVLETKPPENTLIMNPEATIKESRMITFLR